MENKSAWGTKMQAESAASFVMEGPGRTGSMEEAADESPMPVSEGVREEMDGLYERYGDAFRRLR